MYRRPGATASSWDTARGQCPRNATKRFHAAILNFTDYWQYVGGVAICLRLLGRYRVSPSLREFRVAETLAACLGSLQSSRRPGADDFALVLGDRGQDMDRQFISMWVVDRDELHTGIHERRDECQVTRKAIELSNHQFGFVSLAGRKRVLQFRSVATQSSKARRKGLSAPPYTTALGLSASITRAGIW